MIFLDLLYLLDYIWKGPLGFAELPAFPRVPTNSFGSPVMTGSA